MTLSVIIPVYNCSEWVDDCLESLAAQHFKDFEILAVDDHGSDDSMEKIRLFAAAHPGMDIKYLATACNSGPGEARNVGIRAAVGEYVTFLDADDTVQPLMFDRMIEQARLDNDEVVYCQARQIFPDGHVKLLKNPPYFSRSQFLKSYVGGIWNGWLMKTEFLRRHDLLFPPFHASEDSAFAGAAILMAEKVSCVEEPLYNYMVHSQSVSRKKDSGKAAQKRAAFRWLISYAKQKGVYGSNKSALQWLYLKKAVLVPFVERFKR